MKKLETLHKYAITFTLLLAFLLGFPSISHADIPSVSVACTVELDDNGEPIPDPLGVSIPDPNFPGTYKRREGLTYRIVTCVEDILVQVGKEQFEEIRDELTDIIVLLLTLYIVILSYQVALGKLDRPQAEIIGHILKVTAVAAFTIGTGLDTIFPIFVDAREGLVEMVTRHAVTDGYTCALNKDGIAYESVWERVDCTIASILQADLVEPGNFDLAKRTFSSGAKTPYTLGALVLGVLFSGVGLVVAILTLVLVILLVLAFASAVVYYLMALIAIIILTLIAPIIIPAYLFRPTKGFFDNWLQSLIAYTVQPVILFGFLAFMTHAMDLMINGKPGDPDFGLKPVMQKVQNILNDPNSEAYKTLVGTSTATDPNEENDPAATGEAKQDREVVSAIAVLKMDLEDSEVAIILLNLISITMILFLLMSFMFNVMAFGAQIAGMPFQYNLGQFTGNAAAFMGGKLFK